jgi:hypothetical protein
MKFIKIYGIQRTGTNYIEWLLNNNFSDCHVLLEDNVLGWKHGKVKETIDWSDTNKSYIDYHKKNLNTTFIIKYEDYIESSFSEILKKVEGVFGLTRKHKEFINQLNTIGARCEIRQNKFDNNYIINKDYMKIYDEQTLKSIEKDLNPDILSFLGY